MEDARIPELDDIGREYAKIRDARMELNQQEAELKQKGLGAMRRFNKTHYQHRDGGEEIEITVEPPDGNQKFKVRIGKVKDADE